MTVVVALLTFVYEVLVIVCGDVPAAVFTSAM